VAPAWQPAVRILGNSAARFLGRVSFGVYLVHFPILGAVMAHLFVRWGHISTGAFAGTVLVYLLVIYSVGYAFTIFIDELATRLSTWVKRTSRRISFWRKRVLPDPACSPSPQ
jgi:peptidoglycan/LPS O-acetylase OafA/YrhL